MVTGRCIFCLIVGSSIIHSGSAPAQIPQIERDALSALYYSTDGDNWTDNSNWLEAEGTECSWFGVVCSGGSTLVLNLDSNNLNGSIPLELGNLTNLRTLSLGNNLLSGSIPIELLNLSVLEHLNLCDNFLYTNDIALQVWLDVLQPGWEDCQGVFGDNFDSGDTSAWSASVP